MPAKRDLTAYLRPQRSSSSPCSQNENPAASQTTLEAGQSSSQSENPAASQTTLEAGQSSSQSEDPSVPADSQGTGQEAHQSSQQSHRRKSAAPKRMRKRQFVLLEAQDDTRSGDEEEGEESDDEEEEEEELEQEEDVMQDSPGFHRRVDAMHETSGTDFVAPYFPLALAVSRESPLEFNFDLRLLDDLRLPCELVARAETPMMPAGQEGSQEVTFTTSEEAVHYCQQRLREGWLVEAAQRDPRNKRQRLSHPGLQKAELFKEEGKSLQTLLGSGIPELDLGLDQVRLDRFENVMVWQAPEWSLASVQYTHGFPRRLIPAEHGGFLPGNIILTAKASNLAIRRMSVMDVASLLGRQSIAGAGLSLGRLLNLRYAAVRYHRSETYLPDYLVRGTLEFGINFLTFQALEPETLDALANCLKQPWVSRTEGEGEKEDDDQELSLSRDLLSSIGHRSLPTEESELTVVAEQRDKALNRMLSNSVAQVVLGQATEVAEAQESPAGASAQKSNQVAPASRKRKRKGTSSAGSRPAKNQSTAKTPETVGSDEDSTSSEEQTARASTAAALTRTRDLQLDTCPVRGLRKDVFPEGEAKRKLFQFLGQHQPLDPQVVESKAGGSAVWENPGNLSKSAVLAPAERTGEVQRLLRDLFGKLRHQCVCQERHCALRSQAQTLSGDPASPCQSPSRCPVCLAFEAQPRELYTKCLASKNQRLNLLLCCCPAIAKICRLAKAPATMSADESQQHELDVRNLLRELVKCGDNRLNCMRNIGDLAEITPRLLCAQLRTGHSEFWNHLRTVAKVVNKQPTLEAKVAALIAIRKLVPPGNHWSFYLACADQHGPAELDILQRWTRSISQSGSAAQSASSSSSSHPQGQN